VPFYEYKCSTCGKTFEVMQSMSDEPLTHCTGQTCVRDDGKRRGRGRISRVLHAPAIHFKGSGVHNTDYGSRRRGGGDDSGGSGGDTKSGDSDSGGTSSSSSDSGSDSGKTVGLDKV
jgi:putative FmdB family regulatory protein